MPLMTKLVASKYDLTSTLQTNLPDLLLSTIQPSLAIMLNCEKDSLNTTVTRFSEIQRKFGNSIGVIISNEKLFDEVCMSMPVGTMRLLYCKHVNDLLHVINEAYNLMKDKEKLSLQTKYFKIEKESLNTVEKAQEIIYETLHNLNVPDNDIDLIVDGFPTISQIITTSYETMELTSPVDLISIDKVTSFFN